jgi:peptidoglycan/xylan/chitin deacetylase (PgdA/CDA1 family)
MHRSNVKKILCNLALYVTILVHGSSPSVHAGTPVVLAQGPATPPSIALTFDIEGNAEVLPHILDVLAEHNVHATFFILGTVVDQSSAPLLPRAIAAGHELGNHSYSHPRFLLLTPQQMREEIINGQIAIQRAVHQAPSLLFRPPYGEYDNRLLTVLKETGYTHLVMWSIDPQDWAGTAPEAMSELITQQAQHGSIVLFHDFKPNTPAALKLLIPKLKARGFQFVTISTLVK